MCTITDAVWCIHRSSELTLACSGSPASLRPESSGTETFIRVAKVFRRPPPPPTERILDGVARRSPCCHCEEQEGIFQRVFSCEVKLSWIHLFHLRWKNVFNNLKFCKRKKNLKERRKPVLDLAHFPHSQKLRAHHWSQSRPLVMSQRATLWWHLGQVCVEHSETFLTLRGPKAVLAGSQILKPFFFFLALDGNYFLAN